MLHAHSWNKAAEEVCEGFHYKKKMFAKLTAKHIATFLNITLGNRHLFDLWIVLLTCCLSATSYVAYFFPRSFEVDGKPRDKVTWENTTSSNFVRLKQKHPITLVRSPSRHPMVLAHVKFSPTHMYTVI